MNGKLLLTLSLIVLSTQFPVTSTRAASVESSASQQQQTRRYEAHGYFWNGHEFEYEYQGRQPRLQDKDIFAEVLGEAGIAWQNGDRNWRWDELVTVTTAVVKFMHKVGDIDGGARLKALLGNDTIYFVRGSHSALYPGATAQRTLNHITFFDEAFAATRSAVEIYGTAVHELAHLIGDQNHTPDGRSWREAFPYKADGLGLVAPGTYDTGNPEYYAEGVKLWVFPDYPTAWRLDDSLQGTWLAERLHG